MQELELAMSWSFAKPALPCILSVVLIMMVNPYSYCSLLRCVGLQTPEGGGFARFDIPLPSQSGAGRQGRACRLTVYSVQGES